ncbi:Diaminopropionate ammonia-lyase [Roseovarius aestuarii]|uniref:Diaminopropionate ammonia-lyase n=3 Tax=Roseovarius aestuarii TaxID=475083 RepID=A0A1X7BNM5_9RHOB|nr:Diaminopropionate ammonia-lyase [Roseovarius aestuarii]
MGSLSKIDAIGSCCTSDVQHWSLMGCTGCFTQQVIRVDGDYDATVAQTRVDADAHGWLIVSDTSWPGYMKAPLDVMAGYGVMAREVVRDLPKAPTHVLLQGGVGGLAAAVAAVFQQEWGENAPRVIVVEPELAPCLFASAKAGTATSVNIEAETLMDGLSCGEPSEIAWRVLDSVATDFLTIPETNVAPTVRMLAQPKNGQTMVEAGESGVAGLCGLICAALQDGLREHLRLDGDSVAVLIGSEGITDPNIFQQIMTEDI